MNTLTVTAGDENIQLDEFYKSLLFQHIMDDNYPRNERDTLLVILRKTIHFNKWSDRIATYWLTKSIGVSENTLRDTIKSLEAKGLLTVDRSKGGRTTSAKKYNSFALSNDLLLMMFDKWYQIKEENGFTPKIILNAY